MRRWLRGRRSESGQSLVEFAMVLPLLLLIVFAIIDFGRIYQANVTLTNAAREGARLGTTGASATAIQQRVSDTAPGLGATSSVSYTGTGVTGDSVIVQATATVQFITPMGRIMSAFFGGGLGSTSVDLSTTADMRIE